MADVLLRDFPDALLKRVDRYIRLLEDLNPGHRWTRTAVISTLLARTLAEIEGASRRTAQHTPGHSRQAPGAGGSPLRWGT